MKTAGVCTGVLVSGSSGCGKTSLVQAVAYSLNMHFYDVSYYLIGCKITARELTIMFLLIEQETSQ